MTLQKDCRPEGGRSASGSKSPPDGGWGWAVVAGCFLATICIRAVTRCFSMFIVELQMYFEKDYSTTAWIYSMIDCTTMLCAPLGSFLSNRLSCRATMFLGGLLSSTGLVLSSFASSLEFLYLSLGVITGLGFALSYTPAIAMVGKYFNDKKALAYGIALSGSGIGTFILAPAVQLLIDLYSWRGALLILGGFVSNLCVCGALMRPLEHSRDHRVQEKSLTNMEKVCITAALEAEFIKQRTADYSHMEQTPQEIHTLKVTGDFKGHMALLPNTGLPERGEPGQRKAEYNLDRLETILGEVETSDSEGSDGSSTFKLEESKTFPDTVEDLETGRHASSDSTEALVDSQPTLAGWRFCLESRREFSFLKMRKFLILAVSFLFLAYGCSAPVVYLVSYSLNVGVEPKHAAFLMSTFGVSGIIGNISYGWIADRKCLKQYRMLSYILAIGMEGICCLLLPILHSFPFLALFSAVYGYFDGAYVALMPVVTSDAVGPDHLTSTLGVVYFLHAIPYLVSPPIGGWLVDQTGSYAGTFYLSGAFFLVSSVILMAAFLAEHVQHRTTKPQ